ncbi:hypothetical protein KJ865_05345 [Myxococcota bacterium]|nr:hypothetical protein [Myxococcota bacterium]
MSFVRRYPEQEIIEIGRGILELSREPRALPVPIVDSMKEIGNIALRLHDLLENGADHLARADFERDELVRSLALHLKSWAHRRTDPKRYRLAHRLYKEAFGESYTWISSSYSEESREIEALILTLGETLREECVQIPGLLEIVEELRVSQQRFVETEQELAGAHVNEPRVISRGLRVQFHQELDRYISLIDSHFKAYVASENSVRRMLVAPLIAATERLHLVASS